MNQTIDEKNKALVLKAFDTLFNNRDYAAAERYWSPHYIQHSAHIAPGREGLFDLIKSLPPTLKYEPGLILAEGDFVIVHGRFSGFGAPVNWICRRYRSSPRRDTRRALGRDSGRGHAGTVKERLAHVRRQFRDPTLNGRIMATALSQNLPDALKSIRTRPLFVLRLQVPPYYVVGATPGAFRRIGIVLGGLFEGERLSGEVLGGNDWQSVRNDGCTKLDVRIVLKATDGALIVMTYQALRHGPRDVMEKLDEGKPVDPASYYFRMNPLFETSAERYDWLNRIIALGTGHRLPDGPVYSIFEVL